MPRIARFVIQDHFYHITQRGNNQKIIFHDDQDRKRYLLWMEEYRTKYAVKIFAYCLMSNHVHLIIMPNEQASLARIFNTVHMRYAQYYNRRYQSSGHLWQGRYYSCLLDEKHLAAAVRYVERNPVRVQMTRQAWHWPWSSAGNHLGKINGLLYLSDIREFLDIENWQEYLGTEDAEEDLKSIRQHTISGHLWGTPEFTEKLENKYNIQLTKSPPGRPYK